MISNLQLNDIIVNQSKGFVHIILNRPRALNAITLEMTRVLSVILDKAEADPSVKGVFISGEGDRAFCAGGDLKALYHSGMTYRRGEASDNLASIFFEEEYHLNRQIKGFSKLYISFLNGITMGGGYGVSGHGSHVVATNLTRFAMPEVKIGFFPDIGASFNLIKCPHNIGLYLALTGETIGGDDMVFAGLADGYIEAADIDRVQAKITERLISDDVHDAEGQAKIVDDVLKRRSDALPDAPSMLEENAARIEHCFDAEGVEEIIERVAEDDSDWGRRTLKALQYACPMSLAVAFEQFKRVREMNFGEVMAQDYILATHFIQGHDLYEGIKTTLIDRGQAPVWEPVHLSDISIEEVTNYFLPVNLL